jgi:heme/copper-type cytochrome/quinol oxidase subunit 3
MSFFKLFFNHFIMSPSNLVAFHSSAIYWAFVDYAWIAILALIYIWGS